MKESVITPVSMTSTSIHCDLRDTVYTNRLLSVLGGVELVDMRVHEARPEQSLGVHSDHEESYSGHGHWGKS